ncbi:MAG: hypothetical protein KC503_10195, partial [Myxococcales bacterium]|nr:hypothetical protein [Myxococcales bacterium]
AALDALLAAAETMVELEQLAPSVDLALVALTLSLGLSEGTASTLFCIGRMAGWVAHVLEQREDHATMLRPRARFVGPAGRSNAAL